MTKPIDPGEGKSREEAKALRLKAWKRPKLKKDRQAQRTERIKGVTASYGDTSISG